MATKSSTKQKSKIIRTEHPYIVCVEGLRGGEPIIEGSGISVWLIASFHKMGDTVEAIATMYPQLSLAGIYDALSYYYDHQTEIEKRLAENKNFHEHFDQEMEKDGYAKVLTEKGVVLWNKLPAKRALKDKAQ